MSLERQHLENHSYLFNQVELDTLKELRKELHRQDDVDKLKELILLVETVRKGISDPDKTTIKAFDKLQKKHKKLFSKKNSSLRKRYIKLKKKQQEQEQKRRQEEQAQQAAQLEEERQFQLRRTKQLHFANHPLARTIQFSKLCCSEHATFRWNDRGLDYMTLPQMLAEIDSANIFFRLYEDENSKRERTWQVQLHSLQQKADRAQTTVAVQEYHKVEDAKMATSDSKKVKEGEEDAKKNRTQSTSADIGEKGVDNEVCDQNDTEKEITLVLDWARTKIITILRDDEEYDYKVSDHMYAPTGLVHALMYQDETSTDS